VIVTLQKTAQGRLSPAFTIACLRHSSVVQDRRNPEQFEHIIVQKNFCGKQWNKAILSL